MKNRAQRQVRRASATASGVPGQGSRREARREPGTARPEAGGRGAEPSPCSVTSGSARPDDKWQQLRLRGREGAQGASCLLLAALQRRGGLTRDGFEKKLQNRGSPIRLSLQSPSWLLGVPAHSLPPIYFSLNLLEISSRTVAGKASQAPQQRRATSPRTPSKEGTPAGPAGLLQLDVAHLMLAVSTTVSKLRATGLAWVHLSCHVNQQVAASRKPHPADQVTVTKAASMAT